MRAQFLTTAALVATLTLAACSNPQAKGDAGFAETATVAGMFEVESSHLALEKATKPRLKEFAQMMIDDHGKANDELRDIVESGKAPAVKATKFFPKHSAIVRLSARPAARAMPSENARVAPANGTSVTAGLTGRPRCSRR